MSLPFKSAYFSVDLPLDLNVLVVSSNVSALSCMITCPWHQDEAHVEHTMTATDVLTALPSLRMWWASVRHCTATLTDETIAIAENDFVNARQVDSRLTSDDFNIWLSLARLVAVSYGNNFVTDFINIMPFDCRFTGESEITPAHWAAMRSLERRRINRRTPHHREFPPGHGAVPAAFLSSASPDSVVI
jgi:hypothetical protein